MEKRVYSGLARSLWAALFVLGTCALLIGGYKYYQSETERIRQEKYQEISAIGKLKAGQIEQWRQERLGDISQSSKAPFFGQAIREWLRDTNSISLQAKLQDRLVLEQKEQGYADVLLLDAEYRVLLSAEPQPHPLRPATKRAIEQALTNRTPMLSDLYRCPTGMVHLDAVGPILDAEGRPLAVLVLRSNADSLLYPLIQSWPTPSRTAETLLVCRDGQDVLFLNDLRHQPDSALSLREPLTRDDSPAVQAVWDGACIVPQEKTMKDINVPVENFDLDGFIKKTMDFLKTQTSEEIDPSAAITWVESPGRGPHDEDEQG